MTFLFMLIPNPWDYQELSDLPRFADGTVLESESKVVNFHFLTLKTVFVPRPLNLFFLNEIFYIVV